MTFTLRERFHLWRAMRRYNPDGSFTPLETTIWTTPRLCPECNTGPGHWNLCSQYERTTRKWWRWFLPPRKCAPCRLNIWHCHECNSTMPMNHTSVCSKRTSYFLKEIERTKAKLRQTLAVPPEAVFKAGPIGPNHVPEQLDTVVIRDDTGHVRVHQPGSQHGWPVVAPGGYIPR